MNKYSIEIKHFAGFVILGYHEGRFCYLSFEHVTLSNANMARFMQKFPLAESEIEEWKKLEPNFTVTRTAVDVSFDAFWKLYNYKIGKKSRAESLWNELSDNEKGVAMNAVKDYNRWLLTKSIEKAYAETWLGQRRWENVYK